MAKIKLTKSELKTQRDALKQFQRFLPTLQLKKQQLQGELEKCREKKAKIEAEQEAVQASIKPWCALFGGAGMAEFFESQIEVESVQRAYLNIAGVKVPECKQILFVKKPLDYYLTDPWVDDALAALQKIASLHIEKCFIDEQYRLLYGELRQTTQRVNLFEKVKIPECLENIRKVQIYINDQDATAVVRSKIAKKKLQELNV